MKTHQEKFVMRKAVVAIQVALLAMMVAPVQAADSEPTVAELSTPDKIVQAGLLYTSKDSYKFGEYNGLEKSGFHPIIGLDLNGKGDDSSTAYWRVQGSDLGLESSRLEAEIGNQGTSKFRFLFDQLPHKISDSYQTIFNGVGSTALTLPASYPAIGTRVSATSTSAQMLANWGVIQSPNASSTTTCNTSTLVNCGPGYLIPALMHEADIGTKRTKLGTGVNLILAPGWEFSASVQSEEKKGTKLTGFAFSGASQATMLAEPINFKTDTYNGTLGYKSEKATVNLAYNVSNFQNNITSWTAQTPFQNGSLINNQGLFSSAPDNQMQQLNLSGGYRFTPTTRLSYEWTKSRMTQNAAFNYQSIASWSVPVNSANAKVSTDMWFLKLSSRPLANLNLNASYKHDNRDNQTPVNTYSVAFADSSGAGSSKITNDPVSSTKNLFDLNGEYSFMRGQAIKLGFQQENISRSSSGTGYAPSVGSSTTTDTYDYTLPSQNTRESTWNAEYRNSVVTDLIARIAFSESKRKSLDYFIPNLTDTTASNTITNPYYRAFRDFFVASRTRDKLRGAVNYQVSEPVALGFSVDYNRDQYDDAALKESKSTIFNFEVTYTPTENFSVSPYYTYEDRKSTLGGKYIALATAATKLNGVALTCSVVVPCVLLNSDWTLSQADRVDTLGIGAKYKGLISGKLDVNADLLLIHSKTPVTANGGGTLVSDGGTTAAGPNYTSLAALSFPDITSRTVQLRLVGDYKVDKSQSVRVSYMFQRLISSDWQYDAYTNPVVMQAYIGTGQTSPQYTVNAVGASYIYKF